MYTRWEPLRGPARAAPSSPPALAFSNDEGHEYMRSGQRSESMRSANIPEKGRRVYRDKAVRERE